MMKQTSLKSFVYNAILDGIIKDEYKPNQIINEQELVTKYGYSKTPIREALIALCNEGVLHNIPRYGYEVVRLTRENVDQLLNYRLILEGGYLTSFYQTITEKQFDRLIQLDELCNNSSDDMWTHWEHNKNFHVELLSFSQNQYACQELSKSMDILKRAYAQFYWDKWDTTVIPADMECHMHLIENLRQHNIKEALIYLESDLKNFGG